MEKHVRNYLIVLAGILVSGCTSTLIPTMNERSDPQPTAGASSIITREEHAESIRQLSLQQGLKDTDGKPGEPNCPDCDGNGPTYLASIRPSR